jgi:methylated-DNA-[protein]-cysteine S-methyltransferase
MRTATLSSSKRNASQQSVDLGTFTLSVFESDLGWMAIVAQGHVLHRLSFGYHTEEAATDRGGADFAQIERDDEAWPELVARLKSFAAGNRIDFADVQISESHLSTFERTVVTQCRQIPYGQTLSYGHLAARSGSPSAARAVGNVMAANRFPLVVPCHRVVHAGGMIGRFTAPGGSMMKRRLLVQEGALGSGRSLSKKPFLAKF